MTDVLDKGLKRFGVTVSKPILAVITIVFGLLVIIFPQFLALLVGLYFKSREYCCSLTIMNLGVNSTNRHKLTFHFFPFQTVQGLNEKRSLFLKPKQVFKRACLFQNSF
jgi:hypothetical protein